jgi:hypothetical protein
MIDPISNGRKPQCTITRIHADAGGRNPLRRTTGQSLHSLRRFGITRVVIEPHNRFGDGCQPFTEIPAWWTGFVFHVLNARQISLYLYLCMLLDAEGLCAPTVEQIRQDLGLSGSIVFGALGALTERGFILRQRLYLASLRSRRNVYQRPACEFTLLRLLEAGMIDGELRAVPGPVHQMSADSAALKNEWLEKVLGSAFDTYAAAPVGEKAVILIEALRAALQTNEPPQPA